MKIEILKESVNLPPVNQWYVGSIVRRSEDVMVLKVMNLTKLEEAIQHGDREVLKSNFNFKKDSSTHKIYELLSNNESKPVKIIYQPKDGPHREKYIISIAIQESSDEWNSYGFNLSY